MKTTELQNQLKQLSSDLGISYQQAVTAFFAEDFLRRLGKSDFQNDLALCGGWLTYAYTGMIARPFSCVELCGRVENPLQTVTTVLRKQSGGAVAVSDMIPLSHDTVQYTARLGDVSLPVRITFKNTELPTAELYELPILLDNFSAPTVMLPTVEDEVCRRLTELVWQLPLVGRVDALFDLYFWSVQFNFTAEELHPVLREHLSASGLSAETLKSTFALWKDPALERRWKALIRTAGMDPDFKSALGRTAKFLRPVWEAVFNETRLEKDWNAKRARWEERAYLY